MMAISPLYLFLCSGELVERTVLDLRILLGTVQFASGSLPWSTKCDHRPRLHPERGARVIRPNR